MNLDQITLHKKIDVLLNRNIDSINQIEINNLIETNYDARQYFFTKVNEDWFEYLQTNGFLDVIRKVSDSSDKLKMPELDYLFRVVDKKPDLVTNFICSFKISSKNLNSEVLSRFRIIAGKLSAKYLKRIVKKSRD